MTSSGPTPGSPEVGPQRGFTQIFRVIPETLPLRLRPRVTPHGPLREPRWPSTHPQTNTRTAPRLRLRGCPRVRLRGVPSWTRGHTHRPYRSFSLAPAGLPQALTRQWRYAPLTLHPPHPRRPPPDCLRCRLRTTYGGVLRANGGYASLVSSARTARGVRSRIDLQQRLSRRDQGVCIARATVPTLGAALVACMVSSDGSFDVLGEPRCRSFLSVLVQLLWHLPRQYNDNLLVSHTRARCARPSADPCVPSCGPLGFVATLLTSLVSHFPVVGRHQAASTHDYEKGATPLRVPEP